MKNNKIVGVTGYKGKLGSILVNRPSFVPFNCDVTQIETIEEELKRNPVDLIVNCAGWAGIERCENDPKYANLVNVHGLHNLHKAFGSKVLAISSDYAINPVNEYGWSKVGMESISHIWEGKVIRLSRTISSQDEDIKEFMYNCVTQFDVYVPSFFYRNYLHRHYAVNGIQYFAEMYDELPNLINYGSKDNVSMYDLILKISKYLSNNTKINKRKNELDFGFAPRPYKVKFNVSAAKKLGFPMYSLDDTVSKLVQEWKG